MSIRRTMASEVNRGTTPPRLCGPVLALFGMDTEAGRLLNALRGFAAQAEDQRPCKHIAAAAGPSPSSSQEVAKLRSTPVRTRGHSNMYAQGGPRKKKKKTHAIDPSP